MLQFMCKYSSISGHSSTEERVRLVSLAEVPDVDGVVAAPGQTFPLQVKIHQELMDRHHPELHQVPAHQQSLTSMAKLEVENSF